MPLPPGVQVRTTPGPQANQPLQASLKPVKKSYGKDDPISVEIELQNTSNMDLYVLSWLTPLEGLYSDCLNVTRDGRERVEYDGPMLKRGEPSADDYLEIKAGQSIRRTFDLGRAYDVNRPGDYRVEIDTIAQSVVPQLSQGLQTSLRAKAVTDIDQPLHGGATQFQVMGPPGRSGMHQTEGEQAREQERRSKSGAGSGSTGAGPAATSAAAAGAQVPAVAGGSAPERSDTLQAHQDGHQLCVNALSALNTLGGSDPDCITWFGAYDATRFAVVKTNFQNMTNAMKSTTFIYDLSRTGCIPGAYAYTYKGTTTIWICDAFFKARATGTDSRAGTVVHEHSHATSRCDDHAYGSISSQKLAKSDPAKAVKNADNYEYFAKG